MSTSAASGDEARFRIRPASTPADMERVRSLLREYAGALGVDLSFQGFTEELAGLPGEYASPRGALLLAEVGGLTTGCVALRPLDDQTCEMKRLYVRSDRRGSGVGARLARAAIEEAMRRGFATIRLDTLPSMHAARALYAELGFREIAPYRYNPVPGTSFLERELWPITFDDVVLARQRMRAHLAPTAMRRHPLLEEAIGAGMVVWVKHENHQPTGAFKVRNAVAALTALPEAARRAGVAAAARGNHGLGLAWAGRRLGIRVTVCVPRGNDPEKNAAMRAWGAEVVERGGDDDEAEAAAGQLGRERGLTLVHATRNRDAVAGAGTLALEMLEGEGGTPGERPDLDALVFAVGGGSQAAGGIVVARRLAPALEILAVQAAGASAMHDAWHAGRPLSHASADTFADGLASRHTCSLTFDALRVGLSGFVTVSENELAEAVRLVLRTSHNLVEGAGAAGLAGLLRLRDRLAGRRVGIVFSGANIDAATLRRVLGQ